MSNHANPCRRASAALLVALALPACTSFYYAIPLESEIARLDELGGNYDNLAPRTSKVPVDLDGTRLEVAVEETHRGDGSRVIVAIHGVLSDRTVWRYVAGSLGLSHDLMLIDLPGSGESDKPDPEILGEQLYSPESLARAVFQVLRDKLGGESSPEHITLMAHSLGGRIVLAMLADPGLREEYADVVSRVDSTVLLAGLDVTMANVPGIFRQIAELSDLEADLGSLLGILTGECADATYNYAADPNQIPREMSDRLAEILSDFYTRHAQQAMLRQAIPLTTDGRPDFDRSLDLEAYYDNVTVPTLILWGARDETLPVSMGYKLAAQLPEAWLRVLPSCTHALATERPVLIAELVRRFLQDDRVAIGGRFHSLEDSLPETQTMEALLERWGQVLPRPAAVVDAPAQDRAR